MAKARFKAEVKPSGGAGGGHLVEVPANVVAALRGSGRIPVRATFNGVAYRGSIVRLGGITMLGVTKAVMGEAGVGPGDRLEVVVENDDAPREVEVPREFAEALRRNRKAEAAWERLPYSHRREYVDYITEAKKEETRARRVQKTVEALEERGT